MFKIVTYLQMVVISLFHKLIIDYRYNDLFSRLDGQLVSSYPPFTMASGLNQLKNAFLIVSRLTIVKNYECKNSHPFTVECSTDR